MAEPAGRGGNEGRPPRRVVAGGFKRPTAGTTIRDGQMSQDVASRVFRDFLTRSGITSHDEATRDHVLSLLAECLIPGTSSDRNYNEVIFEYDNGPISLETLAQSAAAHTIRENPVRVWARSYNNGEMAARMSDLIITEENLELRQAIALRYGCPVSDAHLCFDIAEVLATTGRRLSNFEIERIGYYKGRILEIAGLNANKSGMVTAAPDRSTRIQSNISNPTTTAAATAEARSRFATAR